MPEVEDDFRHIMDNFAIISGFADIVENTFRRTPSDLEGQLAMKVFRKTIAHSRTIGAIVRSGNFDHSAICACSRLIMESSIVISYLHKDMGEDENKMRILLLDFNDVVSRIKFLRSFNHVDAGLPELRQKKAEMILKIERSPIFINLSDEQKKQYKSGVVQFIGGLRRAAKIGMGWNEDRFDSLYGYFSTHTHSSPMSFYRMSKHEVDFQRPSEAQYATASMAVSVALACMRRVTLNIVDRYPEYVNEFWGVEGFRSDDAEETLISGEGLAGLE